MNEQQKKVLTSNYQFLQKNLLAEKLCGVLIEHGVITMGDEKVIRAISSPDAQVNQLLEYVCRSPVPNTFQIFMESLKENGWKYVEEKLTSAMQKLVISKDEVDSGGQCNDKGAECVREVHQPVSYFCHRKGLEERLWRSLKGSGYAVLAGIKGAGKSQLARHMIHQIEDRSTASQDTFQHHGVSMEINSRNVSNLHSGIEYLMQVLNLSNEMPKSSMDTDITSSLNTILLHLKTRFKGFHFLMFDDVTIETYSFLTSQFFRASLKLCDRIKVLVTTNNMNLYNSDAIVVGGLDKNETLELFKFGYESNHKDEDILELGEHLSHLPLGIAVAKRAIRKRHQSIQSYLKQLLSPELCKKLQSKEEFLEKEYDRGLMSALTISIGEIESCLDKKIFKLYELTALGSHVRFPLGMLKMLMKWTNNEAERDLELGNLIEAITDTAVGTITEEDGELYLDTHQAVLIAIRLNWSSNELHENIESFLLLMSKVCFKDTHFQDAFRVQMTLLPHAEAVMKHVEFDHTTIGLQIAEIRLLEAIGHMYMKMSMLDKAQNYLLDARDCFAKYFLNDKTSLFQENDENSNMKKNAEVIFRKLEEQSAQVSSEDILQFVLECFHRPTDCNMWRTFMKNKFSADHEEDLFTGPTLSKEEFALLQEHKMALSESQIQKLFLPELLITTLFTLGRIYFFRSSKGEDVAQSDVTTLKSSLQLAHDLCVLINEKYNVSLVHLLLTRHYGLLYLKTEKQDEPQDEFPKMVKEAKSSYENILTDVDKYFQGGLLKKVANEDYNIAVCLRQLIRCQVSLLRYDIPENWEEDKQKGLSYVRRLQEILTRNEASFHVSGFNLNIARFYAEIALNEKSVEEYEKAVQLYIDCCDTEHRSGYVRYAWFLALKGLGYLIVSFGIHRDHYSVGVAIRKTEDFKDAIRGRSATFPFEWRKACQLLDKLHEYEEFVASGPPRSSILFLGRVWQLIQILQTIVYWPFEMWLRRSRPKGADMLSHQFLKSEKSRNPTEVRQALWPREKHRKGLTPRYRCRNHFLESEQSSNPRQVGQPLGQRKKHREGPRKQEAPETRLALRVLQILVIVIIVIMILLN